jgi:hypothetical protein
VGGGFFWCDPVFLMVTRKAKGQVLVAILIDAVSQLVMSQAARKAKVLRYACGARTAVVTGLGKIQEDLGTAETDVASQQVRVRGWQKNRLP